MHTDAMKELIAELTRRQEDEGLKDEKFAEKLGVCRSNWSMARRGVTPVGMSLQKAALRCYPELASVVVSGLQS